MHAHITYNTAKSYIKDRRGVTLCVGDEPHYVATWSTTRLSEEWKLFVVWGRGSAMGTYS